MRVVHYLRRMKLQDGGVVRAVLDLCGALAARGHHTTLLTFDDRDAPASWKTGDPGQPRVETIQTRRGPLLGLSRPAARRVRSIFESADVLHLHVPWDPICLHLRRAALRAGLPYVVATHGMLDDWSMDQRRWKKRLYLAMGGRRLLEDAGAVHCTAEAECEQSRKWYPRGRPVVVPLIFDVATYLDLPGPQLAHEKFSQAFQTHGEGVLLFLSRLHPKKRVEVLIEAVAQLRDDGTAVKLLIAGRGEVQYEQSLRRLAQRHEVGEHVAFLGFVSGREKVSVYQAADLFVLPTSQENWGFVLLESLACGTPIITTRGVDIWPELQASGGATIADATAPAFAAAITELLGDQSNRRTMQQKARAWVLQHFDTDHVLGQYERLYKDISA